MIRGFKINNSTKNIVIAMSGGVDSTSAAALLVDQGHNVIGVTMKLWDYEEVGGNINHESGCCSISNINDARIVCDKLGIPHYVVNFSESFSNSVVNNFVDEYMSGRTPNPCVLCNTKIKWEYLLTKINEFNADYIATGHYANSVYDDNLNRYRLYTGKDQNKDQSYALWGIKQKALAKSIFPLGQYEKKDTRKIAERFGLRIARKSESQEICFVPDNDYRGFLKRNAGDLIDRIQKGPMVDVEGELIGEHYGYPFYTIGQRRGLGKGLEKGFGKKLYVVDIQPDSNTVVLGEAEYLKSSGLLGKDLNLIPFDRLEEKKHYRVKIRYNDPGEMAVVEQINDGTVKILFDEPRNSVTPGQSVVFYDGDEVMGGAIIEEGIR